MIDLGLLICPAETGSPLYPNPHATQIDRLSERARPVPLTRRDGDQASSIVLAIDAAAKGKGSDSYCTRDGERRTIYLDRNPIAYNLAPSLYVKESRFTYRAREVA